MNQTSTVALVVIHPFGSYAKGAIITDAALIAAIRADGRSASVIQTVAPAADRPSKGAN